ncbi:MAG: hypothetical protein CMH54_09965 [Myxococcales bacterium]|nr:hypothetical protein [Myxococcales bacterium]|tara:strand:+ start:897 stop:1268 length:372 start_codon:yes stop_codon:yes gene_type:complete
MARPPGRLKSKNGKPVYSQSAWAIRYRKAHKTGEFAEDVEETAAAVEPTLSPGPGAEDPSPSPAPDPIFSSASIGLAEKDEPEPEPEEEETVIYRCNNCRAEIKRGSGNCPTCEMTLDWSGLL